MRFKDRASQIAEGVVAAARHPKSVLRFALHLDRNDGDAMGGFLRREMSPAARRRVGANVLAEDDVVLAFDGGGFKWTVPTGDDVAAGLLADGEYSALELGTLLRWFRANLPLVGDTVVEVGANVGSTTLPLARDGWRVLAIEPVPTAMEFLKLNVSSNALEDSVICVQCAIALEPGVAPMGVSYGLSGSRLLRGSNAESGARTEIQVEVRTLDTAISSAGIAQTQLAFVWCDAEGSEIDVMRGGEKLWRMGIPLYAEFGALDGATPAEFAAIAERHFEAFVPESALQQDGSNAARQPIGEFRPFLAGLQRLQNALLIPREQRDEAAST